MGFAPNLIPFPSEPDAAFAQRLYERVQPIIEGCKDDEWRSARSDLRDTRNPDFARKKWTNEFEKISFEVRMQMAIAFVSMFGGEGMTPSLRETDPRRYGLQEFFYNSDLEPWVRHEIDLRAGAMPIPPDTRAWDLANDLAQGSDGFFTLVTPRPPDVPMPRDNVSIRACEWYNHTCRLIVEGHYSPPDEEVV